MLLKPDSIKKTKSIFFPAPGSDNFKKFNYQWTHLIENGLKNFFL